ncbi:ABC transporter ATP-binding protein [Ureaplasma diversum]
MFPKRQIRTISDQTIKMLNAYDKKRLVEINNLDVTYGSGKKAFRAVKDFNLNVYDGEVLGLVGESGSGKSTIGKALVGLVDYSFGQIKIDNKLLPKQKSSFMKFGKQLKDYKTVSKFMIDKVQMIFQNPTNSLNPHKNIEDVLKEGLNNLKDVLPLYLLQYDEFVFNKIYNQFIKRSNLENQVINFDLLINDIKENDYHNEQYYDAFLAYLTNNQADQTLVDQLYLFKMNRANVINNIFRDQINHKLIMSILKQVGMDESILKRFPLEFSGGQQQRIGIARSIVLRPKLLVADEPISALDVSIQAQVVNIFNDLKEKFNLTIVFIAHDLRMVEYISDRIAVMNKGTLLEIGPTSEIINNPVHPYTKSLLDAVPSIDSNKGSLIGRVYDPNMHDYSVDNQPDWIELENKHFVLATPAELEQWLNEKGASNEQEKN